MTTLPQIGDLSTATLSDAEMKDAIGMTRESFDKLASLMDAVVMKKGILDWQAGTAADPTAALKTTGKPQVNFTGDNHFEMKFEDTDPDRVMLRFQEGLENQVLRRTSSPLSDPLAD